MMKESQHANQVVLALLDLKLPHVGLDPANRPNELDDARILLSVRIRPPYRASIHRCDLPAQLRSRKRKISLSSPEVEHSPGLKQSNQSSENIAFMHGRIRRR